MPRLAGKLPPFGRHAGAALVAHGYLGQDDLWPVLRAHAEWVMGRAILVDSGTCELEADPPARYKAEPSVFGVQPVLMSTRAGCRFVVASMSSARP